MQRYLRGFSLPVLALLAGCGGSSAPVKDQAAPPDPSASPAFLERACQAQVMALAGNAPLVDAPPEPMELGERFRQPEPLSHVRAYLVDEACLVIDKIPPEASKHMLNRISLDDFQEGDLHITSARTDDASAESLAALRAFAAGFGKRRVVIFKNEFIDKPLWMALCLKEAPLFGAKEMGRIRNKDGVFDETAYWVGFSDAVNKGIAKLPPEAQRLVLLWDDKDVVTVLPVDKLKALKNPKVKLAPLPPAE